MAKLILALETSCDETSAAVVEDGSRVLANVISSQIDVHQAYGGVVPEIASRQHVERISFVVSKALETADVSLRDLDAVAVTNGPGLVGALLVGVSYAKGLSYSLGLPLIPVNHIEAHIYANFLASQKPEFPLLCLVVSGGHTDLILMRTHGSYEVLGRTRDDAAGEAFDKIARVLDLPYPGGPHLEQLARKGALVHAYPRAWLEPGSFDFSFSGLKSAVLNHINTARQRGQGRGPAPGPGEGLVAEDVAASFQAAVVDVLVTKTIAAAVATGVREVCLAGGVSANGSLRESLARSAAENGLRLHLPELVYCTDNAAMVGALGYYRLLSGVRAGLDLNAHAVQPICSWGVDK
jgi:N6-L-threonylcarbamoyladenine synthase